MFQAVSCDNKHLYSDTKGSYEDFNHHVRSWAEAVRVGDDDNIWLDIKRPENTEGFFDYEYCGTVWIKLENDDDIYLVKPKKTGKTLKS